MISPLGGVIKDHYATYVNARTGQKEGHKARLVLQLFVSSIFAIVLADLSEGLVSVVVTSLSILTGFSFSAMFPIASDIRSGLPAPSYSEDRDDLERLAGLSSDFRANVSYFIPLTLICIMLFSFQLLDPVRPEFVNDLASRAGENQFHFEKVFACIKYYFSAFLCGVSIFFFIEVIYSFYRMCFTVLYILRIKEEYRASHAARERRE